MLLEVGVSCFCLATKYVYLENIWPIYITLKPYGAVYQIPCAVGEAQVPIPTPVGYSYNMNIIVVF